MSLNDIQNRIDELFTGATDIDIQTNSPTSYSFTIDSMEYNVELLENEIFFNSFKGDGTKTMIPVKNNKNQFIVLNTVIKCVEKIFNNIPKEIKNKPIYFSGNNSNGLAKVYMMIAKKLKNKLPNYVFTTENRGAYTYFIFSKKGLSGKLKSLKEMKNRGNNMAINLKESTTISIINSDGSSISISSDDINELSQIMKNAGLSLPIQTPNDDISIETDGDVEIGGELDMVDYEDEYLNQPKDSVYDAEIPAYDLVSDEDEYYFDLGDTGYDIDYEDPYGDLSNEIGYVEEVAELNASVPYDEDAEESLFNIKGTAHQSDLRYVPGMAADNPMVDELRESIDSEIDDAKSYCRDDIDEAEMIHEIGLSGRAGFISSNEKDELINKLAKFFFFSYRDDINSQTELTDDNFKDIATAIFNSRLEPLLIDRGFKFE